MLRGYLSDSENINVIFQASDALELFNKLRQVSIDILILDITLSRMDIYNMLKKIRKEYPAIGIIVLSESTDLQVVNELLDIGIHGYVSKMDETEEIFLAIAAISENKIYRNKLLTDALYFNRQMNTMIAVNQYSITLNEREKKILKLLWMELSNREIASQLFLGVRSIEKIRQDMKEKLGIKSTIGLFKYGIQEGIIEIDSLLLKS
ncbi:response regulator transcription factor [Chitinophaga oryziterrae]